MFICGGRSSWNAEEAIDDMWRFDLHRKTWTRIELPATSGWIEGACFIIFFYIRFCTDAPSRLLQPTGSLMKDSWHIFNNEGVHSRREVHQFNFSDYHWTK